MIELKRDLGNPRNTLARLFHRQLKPLAVMALEIIAVMPELKIDDFEHYNSREWLNLRDYFVAHEKVPRQKRLIKGFFTFLIMLNEGDEFYGQRIDRGVEKIKVMPFKKGEPIRPEWWEE